jgi:hypothetical protein
MVGHSGLVPGGDNKRQDKLGWGPGVPGAGTATARRTCKEQECQALHMPRCAEKCGWHSNTAEHVQCILPLAGC